MCYICLLFLFTAIVFVIAVAAAAATVSLAWGLSFSLDKKLTEPEEDAICWALKMIEI